MDIPNDAFGGLDSLFEGLHLFVFCGYAVVDGVDLFGQHHGSQFFFEAYLLSILAVFLNLLDLVFEFGSDGLLVHLDLAGHLRLHLIKHSVHFSEGGYEFVKGVLLEATQDVVGLNTCIVDVEAIRLQSLNVLLQTQNTHVQPLLKIFVAFHHLLEKTCGQLLLGIPENYRADELLLVCFAVFNKSNEGVLYGAEIFHKVVERGHLVIGIGLIALLEFDSFLQGSENLF